MAKRLLRLPVGTVTISDQGAQSGRILDMARRQVVYFNFQYLKQRCSGTNAGNLSRSFALKCLLLRTSLIFVFCMLCNFLKATPPFCSYIRALQSTFYSSLCGTGRSEIFNQRYICYLSSGNVNAKNCRVSVLFAANDVIIKMTVSPVPTT